MSRTFLATLHFDGTGFVGWQRQAAGRSVQSEFERVLERLFERSAAAHAAGRTDAGVHAVGLARQLRGAPALVRRRSPPRTQCPPPQRLLGRIGAPDASRAFTPGRAPLSRRYRYDIGLDDAAASPFRRRFEWALGRPLDHAALRSAATLLLRRARLPRLRRQGRAQAALSLPAGPSGVGGPAGRPRRELPRRGRPLPAPHGADAGRHHGGHRPRAPSARRHRGAARARRQQRDQSAGAAARTLLRAARRIPMPCTPTRRRRSMRPWIARSAALLLTAGALGCKDAAPAVRVSTQGAQAAAPAPARAARQAAVDASRRTALVTAAERASSAVVSDQRQLASRRAGALALGLLLRPRSVPRWSKGTAPDSSSGPTASSSPTSTWSPTRSRSW